MMTFLEWFEKTGLYGSLHYEAYKTIWDAAQKYEREECAKVCESMWKTEDGDYHWIPDGRGALMSCAESIRARK